MNGFIRVQTTPNVVSFLISKDEIEKAIHHVEVLLVYKILEIRLNNSMRIMWDNHFKQKSISFLTLGQTN